MSRIIPVVFLSLIVAVLIFRVYKTERRTLHILQLEGYRNLRFLKWLRANWGRYYTIAHLGTLGLLALLVLIHSTSLRWVKIVTLASGFILWLAFETYNCGMGQRSAVKKPLVMTWRAKRILGLTILVTLTVFGSVLATLTSRDHLRDPQSHFLEVRVLFIAFVVVSAGPLFLITANVLLLPLEKSIQSVYLLAGRRKLKIIKPLVIGITGSYGKTTTKNIIGTILSSEYNTLMTPQSYNSLMGVTRTLNQLLLPHHEVLVVEMGAYVIGDIKELCELVEPKIGVLTAIGPQHLERFGSVEAIEETKSELLRSLPKDGLAVVNFSDAGCRKIADRIAHCRIVRVGLGECGGDVYVVPGSPKYNTSGMSFQVQVDAKETIDISTRLLGEHNVTNILCGIAVALELNIKIHDIQKAIRRMEPIPHRLELIRGPNGTIILDDSYNSNPRGFTNALNVLSTFVGCKRILVTPGMVELGPLESQENTRMGRYAAEVCSHVILVGPGRTKYIRQGLIEAGFKEENIFDTTNFLHAQAIMSQLTSLGDVVLVENDLPDNY